MINTQSAISGNYPVSSAGSQARPEQQAEVPRESFEGPRLGFEPWIGPGKPGHPEPAICPKPVMTPGPVPGPTIGIEPWLSGEPTTDPQVGSKFADKLVRTFGEQALLSIDESRIHGCEGYYFKGWESVGGDDFIKGVTLSRLGEGWEMVDFGSYELKSGSVGQRLTFDMANRQTVLESYYEENRYDTTRFSEILRRDEDGSMRRELPPAGL